MVGGRGTKDKIKRLPGGAPFYFFFPRVLVIKAFPAFRDSAFDPEALFLAGYKINKDK